MKRKPVSLIIFVLAIVLIAGCSAQEPTSPEKEASIEETEMEETSMEETESTEGYVDISPADAKALIDSSDNLIIIDVSPKYAEGHLPMAINYYVGDGSLDEAIPDLDMEKTYLVYCHVDSASILGAQKLVDAGFKNVYRLEGNYKAWVDAGYPIEK